MGIEPIRFLVISLRKIPLIKKPPSQAKGTKVIYAVPPNFLYAFTAYKHSYANNGCRPSSPTYQLLMFRMQLVRELQWFAL